MTPTQAKELLFLKHCGSHWRKTDMWDYDGGSLINQEGTWLPMTIYYWSVN